MTISNEIEKLALEISTIEDRKSEIESELKQINEKLSTYERELSDILLAQGFEAGSKIKLTNGRNLNIKEYFSASIPAQSSINSAKDAEKAHELQSRKEACLGWLDANDLSDIIKNNIVISLDRGENEKAKELMLDLQEKGVDFLKEESVHPMTLKAALKNAMKDGIEVPFDVFSVQTGISVEIK
jgi:hypothetical protein